ncbi:DUF3291 domain-containing protein [Oleiharenicola lentus]|uniref:DUF3291 domain-containing protein n=1 Tax=Oleiharenicola lentus TaxID=2508720 RepID=UPI003F662680
MAAAWHLAQINIGRIVAPMDDPRMAEFAAALTEINALAESSPGFVWRLKDTGGDATSIQAFPDPLILVNMSVWTNVELLKHYVYRSVHGKFFARRQNWFEKSETAHLALWWIPAGHVPTVAEAKERLALLDERGPSERAFTFREPFHAPTEGSTS